MAAHSPHALFLAKTEIYICVDVNQLVDLQKKKKIAIFELLLNQENGGGWMRNFGRGVRSFELLNQENGEVGCAILGGGGRDEMGEA